MTRSYSIEFLWSEEDQVGIANVSDLTFCTGQGSTPHDAAQEVEMAVDAWREAVNPEGRVVLAPSRRLIRA